MARRLEQELTPGQAKKLFDSTRPTAFAVFLQRLGYRKIGNGCFKDVWAIPNGRYVIKLGDPNDPHTNGSATRKRYMRSRVKKFLIPILAWSPGLTVQRRVVECNCSRGLRGHWDSSGHNHTHEHGRLRVFDY